MHGTLLQLSGVVFAILSILQPRAGRAAQGVPMTWSFTNSAVIVISDEGIASPYPSAITVSGMTGMVTSVSVTLRGLTHDYPDDLDILLVAPDGRKIIVTNGQNRVSVPLDVSERFFRLRK